MRGNLVFDNVSFRYDSAAEETLRDLSFEVPQGTTVALVGPSGSGKTTIAGLVPRFYEPTEGSILLDEMDIASLSLGALRRQIAFVSQDVVLFNDSVRSNIAYGMNPVPDDDSIIAAAEAANAWEFIRTMPERLDTLVGENGVRLSGGQRQRLAIARAILKDAPVLILDEATSALDTTSEQLVQQALERVRKDRTTLVIAHRLSTIENADILLVIEKGQIVERGTHAQLIQADGAYANLYNRQLRSSPTDSFTLEPMA